MSVFSSIHENLYALSLPELPRYSYFYATTTKMAAHIKFNQMEQRIVDSDYYSTLGISPKFFE